MALPLAISSNTLNDILVPGLLRWAHIISGITWIGMLYFFNFVNVPVQGKLDPTAKKAVNPELMPRALWWFRWGAMSTFVFGVVLFWWKYMKPEGMPLMYDSEHHVSERALWIMLGMTLGTIMWFNVWVVIWPAQKIILGSGKSGTPVPPNLPPRAKLFSRINTVLSAPMLVCMVASNNTLPFDWTTVIVTFVIALLAVHLAIRASSKVGASI